MTTDPHTVVIQLKFASSAFLPALADPSNRIYQKKILDKHHRWYEHNITGLPFVVQEFPDPSVEESATPITNRRGL